MCKQFWFKPIWRRLNRDDYELIATVMKQENQKLFFFAMLIFQSLIRKKGVFIRSKLCITCWYSLLIIWNIVQLQKIGINSPTVCKQNVRSDIPCPPPPPPPPTVDFFLGGGIGVWEIHPKVVCFFITYKKNNKSMILYSMTYMPSVYMIHVYSSTSFKF